MTEIVIRTPQFERTPDMPQPGLPPEDWDALRQMDIVALKELGLIAWEARPDGTVLMLFPGEWHRHLPNGFQLESISGELVIVGCDYVDDDIRFGCLAYGIRVKE